jgi:hypothetical protein
MQLHKLACKVPTTLPYKVHTKLTIGVAQKQNVRQREEIFVEKGHCIIITIMDGTMVGTTAGVTIGIVAGIIIIMHHIAAVIFVVFGKP